MWGRLADSYKGGLDERRRRCRTKGAKRLCLGKRRIVPQDARWDLDLQILRRSQPLPQTSEGRLSIGQVWERHRSSPNPMWNLLACSRQRRKLRCVTREVQSHSTWQKAFCRKGIVKDTSIGGWQHVTFYIMESFSKKGMMGTHYDVWVLRKQERW